MQLHKWCIFRIVDHQTNELLRRRANRQKPTHFIAEEMKQERRPIVSFHRARPEHFSVSSSNFPTTFSNNKNAHPCSGNPDISSGETHSISPAKTMYMYRDVIIFWVETRSWYQNRQRSISPSSRRSHSAPYLSRKHYYVMRPGFLISIHHLFTISILCITCCWDSGPIKFVFQFEKQIYKLKNKFLSWNIFIFFSRLWSRVKEFAETDEWSCQTKRQTHNTPARLKYQTQQKQKLISGREVKKNISSWL